MDPTAAAAPIAMLSSASDMPFTVSSNMLANFWNASSSSAVDVDCFCCCAELNPPPVDDAELYADCVGGRDCCCCCCCCCCCGLNLNLFPDDNSRSYSARLVASPKTEYASPISINFAFAAASFPGFLSGWYLSDARR